MREIIRVEKQGGRYGCSECDWVFNGSMEQPEGDTIEQMKENYLRERDAAFMTHKCELYKKGQQPADGSAKK